MRGFRFHTHTHTHSNTHTHTHTHSEVMSLLIWHNVVAWGDVVKGVESGHLKGCVWLLAKSIRASCVCVCVWVCVCVCV